MARITKFPEKKQLSVEKRIAVADQAKTVCVKTMMTGMEIKDKRVFSDTMLTESSVSCLYVTANIVHMAAVGVQRETVHASKGIASMFSKRPIATPSSGRIKSRSAEASHVR